MIESPSVTVVIPTLARPSLAALLGSLVRSSEATGIALPPVCLVDDRPATAGACGPGASENASSTKGEFELTEHIPQQLPVTVRHTGGRGPAAARNLGWRGCATPWVAFLDDDVLVSPSWLADLARDLRQAPPAVAGSQGRITVPLPADRPPTDWERGTAGLQSARWITADIAYRTAVLSEVGGFDERFPRAFREDADLALAVLDAGYQLDRGTRQTLHPVRPAGWSASIRQQRGNADDVLMRRLHGPDWRSRAEAPLGRRPQHVLTTAAGAAAAVGLLARRRRLAVLGATGWLASTAEFCWRRIAPGPRDRAEMARVVSTSVLIPPAATFHWLAGLIEYRRPARRGHGRQPNRPAAVLVDRDGTIIRDVAYNGDPQLVEPMPGARSALDRLRQAGIPLAVISNQSGIARGLIDAEQVAAVNARVEQLLGPFDAWAICPHADEDRCDCRKPQPGLVFQAARQLDIDPRQCLVIGDIGADVSCALAASARVILVPTDQTRPEEIRDAPVTAATLAEAVDLVLSGGVA